jgi:D-alanine--poly(phosphoribitol) ligase subunit 2
MSTSTILLEFIKKELAIGSKRNIQLEDDLLSAGIIDSLGVLQLVAFIEEQFNIQMPDEDVVLENFQSVNSLANYLENFQKA